MKKFENYYKIFEKTKPFSKKILKNPIFFSILYLFLLIFLFYFFEEKKHYELKVGDIVPKDIITDRPLIFEDIQETEKKRYQAAENVLPVFDFQKNKSSILIKQLDEVFKKKGENGLKIPEEVLKIFSKYNFSQELEDIISGIILQVYQNPVVSSKKYLSTFYQKGYIKRDIETKLEEVSLDVFSPLDYPKEVELVITSELKKVKFLTKKEKEILSEFLVEICTPNLTLNALETNYKREKVMKETLPVTYNIRKGFVIARKGEVLSERQYAILKKLISESGSSKNFNFFIGILLCGILSILFLYSIVFKIKNNFYGFSYEYTLNSTLILNISLLWLLHFIKFIFDSLSSSFLSEPFKISDIWYLSIPFSIGSFLLRLFSPQILALGNGISLSLLSSFIFSPFNFFFPYAICSTLISILSFKQIKSRWDLTKIGIFIGLGNIFCFFAISLIFDAPIPFSYLTTSEKFRFFLFILFLCLFGGIFTSMLVGFLSPLIEKIFGLFSNLRLLELSTQEHSLIKEMALKAPGTYQHSINLSILAERAADAIGANSLLAKVVALFHDVGKVSRPEYFIENQRGKNPHENLEPGASRLILKSHIMEGIEIAKKHKLPKYIIDGILMHHGKKIMHYFYQKAQDKSNGATEEVFRYQGPLPDSKEMTIIFLADSIEAAFRTIEEPEPQNIRNLVEKIIEDAIKDGQLNESQITFKELNIIKEEFIKTLTSMSHGRIEYPNFDFNKKEENGNNNNKQNKDKNK